MQRRRCSRIIWGKLALVTGGTSGIGLGIVEAMLRRGFRVVVTSRDRARGDAAAAQLQLLGEAWFVPADAEDDGAIRSSVEESVALLGGLDALVNNAGVALIAPLLSTPLAEFDRLMRVNLHAVLAYVQAAEPYLTERKGGVVKIASDAGLRGEQGIDAYPVSKAALVMMSRLLALDLAPGGVRCNCVCPVPRFLGCATLDPSMIPMWATTRRSGLHRRSAASVIPRTSPMQCSSS
ncbi:MAG: SDR family NAD(P)-dependent oxidoreductase [Acidimicrobiales bacterium]